MLLTFVLISSVILIASSTPVGRAQLAPMTGVVCLANHGATSCPNTAPTFAGGTNSTLVVDVFIQNSQAFASIDIFVKTLDAVLHPTSVSLTGSVWTTTPNSPFISAECINGVTVVNACPSLANGAGVVEMQVSTASGNNVCLISTCSGLLFTISYTVTGGSRTTPIFYPVHSSCSPYSVQGTTTCVLVRDSVGRVLHEAVQSSAFGTFLVSVVAGLDGSLYGNTFNGTWGGWQPLAGSVQPGSAPALCSSGSGSAELVITGKDGQIYHKSFTNGTWTADWDVAGGNMTGTPACYVESFIPSGMGLCIVARSADPVDSLWGRCRDLPTGTWNSWYYFNGKTSSAPTAALTQGTSYGGGRLDLLVRGEDNRLYDNDGVWNSLSGGTFDRPAAASDGSTLHVVVRGMDNGIWYNSLDLTNPGSFWSGWFYLYGGTPSALTVAVDSSGVLHIVVRGLDNGIYQDLKPPSFFVGTTWEQATGGSASDVPAVATSGTNLFVLVRGVDNGLYYNTFEGSNWGTWRSASGATSAPPALASV